MNTDKTTPEKDPHGISQHSPSSARQIAIRELRLLHARVEQLEAFAKEVEQYGVLLRAGGAAPHDLKDLSAALEQCVELAQGVLK